jgi:tRNA G37 N-methylase TrmD
MGFSEIKQWYEGKGIPLIVKSEDNQKIIELIATRNIIVHNRGRIDEKYLRTVSTSTYKIGDYRLLVGGDLISTLSILNSIVSSTDQAITQKFNLDTIDFAIVDHRE